MYFNVELTGPYSFAGVSSRRRLTVRGCLETLLRMLRDRIRALFDGPVENRVLDAELFQALLDLRVN